MSIPDDLLRECLYHLKMHNEEYSHRTPAHLIERIEGYLRRPKHHTIIIPNPPEPDHAPQAHSPGVPIGDD